MGGLVDYLKSIGVDASKENRKKIAEKYGIKNYDFSAYKNTELLKAIQADNGKLLKAEEPKKVSDGFDKKNINFNPKPKNTGIGINFTDKIFSGNKADYFSINPLLQKAKEKVVTDKDGIKSNKIVGGASKVSSMEDLLNKAGTDRDKIQADKDKTTKSIAKAQTIGQYAVDAAKGINGIVQFIKGKKALKNIDKPKYPEYLNNQILSTRLAEAQQQAQMADPLIRSQGMSELANQRYLMDNIGKAVSGGDISSYGAYAQANADNMNKSIRQTMADEISNKMQKQQILDNLINQQQNERQFVFNSNVNKFNQVDYPEFQARRQYGENLVNTGISNMYGAGESMAVSNSPLLSYMKALNMNKSIQQRERERRMRERERRMPMPQIATGYGGERQAQF